MKQRAFALSAFCLSLLVLSVGLPAAAQEGRLKVKVTPKTGYVLVDGRQMGRGKADVRLEPGDHRLQVLRYGREPYDETLSIAGGETINRNVSLAPLGGTVEGPWGRIRLFVKPDKAALYLNGRSPEYLIACVCDTDKEELLVRPGTHEVAIALDGYLTYTSSISVAENEAVEIRLTMEPGTGEAPLPEGAITTAPQPALAAVTMTARETDKRVAVAPVSLAQFATTPPSLRCGDSARLSWSTTEARLVEISDLGPVAAAGEQLVSPMRTTTYTLRASGPGGMQTATTTVNVDTAIRARLDLSPASINIETLDGVETKRDSATLSWSVDNASAIEIMGVGVVSASASRSLSPDKNTSYTLRATNACGTIETATASLAVNRVDRVSPPVLVQPAAPGVPAAPGAPAVPAAQLGSLFFPTDYPDEENPDLGLLRSQARTVELIAKGFLEYLKVRPEGRLRLEAHADERRSVEYNQKLAERRGGIVKRRLAAAGVPAANIDIAAFGEEQPLQPEVVTALEKENQQPAPKARAGNKQGNWWAHNRRVDVILAPRGDTSVRYYPHKAEDADILWSIPKVPLPRVKRASQP